MLTFTASALQSPEVTPKRPESVEILIQPKETDNQTCDGYAIKIPDFRCDDTKEWLLLMGLFGSFLLNVVMIMLIIGLYCRQPRVEPRPKFKTSRIIHV